MLITSKRYTGFTLAEVLITLSIIGVVAALTIPGLVRNFQEAQWKATAKKTYSELVQATKLLSIENGGNFISAFKIDGTSNSSTFRNKYCTSLKCLIKGIAGGECWHTSTTFYRLDGDAIGYGWGPCAILSDGTFITFYFNSDDCTTNEGGGIYVCGRITFDVNGFKGPNVCGRDIFNAYVTKNGLIPGGVNTSDNCTTQGLGCMVKVLKNEDY